MEEWQYEEMERDPEWRRAWQHQEVEMEKMEEMQEAWQHQEVEMEKMEEMQEMKEVKKEQEQEEEQEVGHVRWGTIHDHEDTFDWESAEADDIVKELRRQEEVSAFWYII